MKIVIPGGSGQVGTVLARAFARDGHEVTVLTRKLPTLPVQTAAPGVSAHKMPKPGNAASPDGGTVTWRTVFWNDFAPNWAPELEGADAVINLAGRSVNCRYYPANRRTIKDSRVNSTRVLGEAIALCKEPPRVWLQASTATIYAHRYDAPNDEETGILGGDEPGVPDTWNFSIDVAKSWEAAANEAARALPATRMVLMRSAITMNADPESAFAVLLRLVQLGLGGTNGNGRQFVSWVHEDDFVRAVYWLIAHDELSGPVNIAAPHPLPNREFMRAFRAAWGIPFGLPANRLMLEAAAFFMRTETELILKSRRVVSTRLEKSGFRFNFPDWPAAARDLCQRWRERQTQ